MLVPKKVKHRKWQKGRRKFTSKATTILELSFGEYGLKAMSRARLTSRQLEAARRVIVRYMRKGGKLWIRVFPDCPITSKGTHFTMGSGKGSPDHFVFNVAPGHMIFELSGLTRETAKEAMDLAGYKLPMKTKFLCADDEV
jgi:large subunit ribosomal protein L16